MGAIHACWCVSECKFESGSCALSRTSPALAGQMPRTDSKNFHSDISEAVRELSVWLITLIKQHSIVARTTLLNNAGIIPSNRPVESWITPAPRFIVQPSSLAGVELRHALTQENRKPRSSPFLVVDFWSGCTCSVSSWNLCVKNAHWPTAWTLPNPLLSPWNAQLEDKGWLWMCALCVNGTDRTQSKGRSLTGVGCV